MSLGLERYSGVPNRACHVSNTPVIGTPEAFAR
jgi:hypothetical protein